MTKTKYQEAATDYANEYLEQLLKMENVLGSKSDGRNEQAVKKYMDEKLRNGEQ